MSSNKPRSQKHATIHIIASKDSWGSDSKTKFCLLTSCPRLFLLWIKLLVTFKSRVNNIPRTHLRDKHPRSVLVHQNEPRAFQHADFPALTAISFYDQRRLVRLEGPRIQHASKPHRLVRVTVYFDIIYEEASRRKRTRGDSEIGRCADAARDGSINGRLTGTVLRFHVRLKGRGRSCCMIRY